MTISQLTMQQLHILHCTCRSYNWTNCDQLHVKICPAFVERDSPSLPKCAFM